MTARSDSPGAIASTRWRISSPALVVNVRASMRNLRFLDSFSILAIRVVSTVVLSTPGPTRTNAAPCSH